jgi:hypothetical protein
VTQIKAEALLKANKTWMFTERYCTQFGTFTYIKDLGDMVDDNATVLRLLMMDAPIVAISAQVRILTCSKCGCINKIPEEKSHAPIGSGQVKPAQASRVPSAGAV